MVAPRANSLDVFMMFRGVPEVMVVLMSATTRLPDVPTIHARQRVRRRQQLTYDKVVDTPASLVSITVTRWHERAPGLRSRTRYVARPGFPVSPSLAAGRQAIR
jgi:hypothetical protein